MTDVPAKITDHSAVALANMLSQFSGAERLRALLGLAVDEIQRAENVAYDVLEKTRFDETNLPAGQILDRLGAILGWRREDLTDTEYRTIIPISPEINASDGLAKQAVSICERLVGTAVRYSGALAHYALDFELSAPLTETWIALMHRVLLRISPPGVSWALTEGDTSLFRFGVVGRGFDEGHLGRRI